MGLNHVRAFEPSARSGVPERAGRQRARLSSRVDAREGWGKQVVLTSLLGHLHQLVACALPRNRERPHISDSTPEHHGVNRLGPTLAHT